MPGFLAIPGCVPLPTGGVSALLAAGLYPMDAASAVAAVALRLPAPGELSLPASATDTSSASSGSGSGSGGGSIGASASASAPPYRVLDLCCCPGAKLALLADTIHEATSTAAIGSGRQGQGHVVGVDISAGRLTVLRSLLVQVLSYQHAKALAIDAVAAAAAAANSDDSDDSDNRDAKRRGGGGAGTGPPAPAAAPAHTRISVFHGDGTAFALPPTPTPVPPPVLFFDSESILEEAVAAAEASVFAAAVAGQKKDSTTGGKRDREGNALIAHAPVGAFVRCNKSAKKREARRLRELQTQLLGHSAMPTMPTPTATPALSLSGAGAFDRVLVDAECSHDGSYRHLRYSGTSGTSGTSGSSCSAGDSAWTGEDASSGVGVISKGVITKVASIHSSAGTELRDLQRGLLLNGYKQCKPGGVVVYSTCSLEDAQNRLVVQWLLGQEEAAGAVLLDPLPALPAPAPHTSAASATASASDAKEEEEEEEEEEVRRWLSLPLPEVEQLMRLATQQQRSGSTTGASASASARGGEEVARRVCKYVCSRAAVPLQLLQIGSGSSTSTSASGSGTGSANGSVGLMSRLGGTSGLFLAAIQKPL